MTTDSSGQITGLLAPLIAISVVMQQILSLLGAKDFVTDLLSNLGGYYPILFACMLIVLMAGTIHLKLITFRDLVLGD